MEKIERLLLDTTKDELLVTLKKKGIHDVAVLNAIASIPRERFVPQAFVRKAYNDVALPIGLNQTISQPYTVAYMTQELHVQPGQNILEIGTGSGYQAAILDAMGAKVVSLERHLGLFEKAIILLHNIGTSVQCVYGDGSVGYQKFAPYDRIIVTAGAPEIPRQLVRQLKINGLMIVPVGDETQQQMQLIERVSQTDIRVKTLKSQFSFVPLLGEDGWDSKAQGTS